MVLWLSIFQKFEVNSSNTEAKFVIEPLVHTQIVECGSCDQDIR